MIVILKSFFQNRHKPPAGCLFRLVQETGKIFEKKSFRRKLSISWSERRVSIRKTTSGFSSAMRRLIALSACREPNPRQFQDKILIEVGETAPQSPPIPIYL